MKVWVVSGNLDRASGALGVFSSRERALAFCGDAPDGAFVISDHEVNAEPEPASATLYTVSLRLDGTESSRHSREVRVAAAGEGLRAFGWGETSPTLGLLARRGRIDEHAREIGLFRGYSYDIFGHAAYLAAQEREKAMRDYPEFFARALAPREVPA